MNEQQAYEAMAHAAMAEQAIGSFLRPLGGKRQRCVCGALEGESCRDHSQVMCFTYRNGELVSVQQGGETLWRHDGEAITGEETEET